MNVGRLLLLSGLLIIGTETALADAHTISYAKKSVVLGTAVPMINGDEYVIIRVPFVTFAGARYSIILPARTSLVAFDLVPVNVSTAHDTTAFTSNITVDGWPARVSVYDFRSYNVSGTVGTNARFRVRAGASATVQIKIDSTILVIAETALRQDVLSGDETDVDVGGAVDFRPYAEWSKYKDPTTEVKVLNDLLDYVRIIAQP